MNVLGAEGINGAPPSWDETTPMEPQAAAPKLPPAPRAAPPPPADPAPAQTSSQAPSAPVPDPNAPPAFEDTEPIKDDETPGGKIYNPLEPVAKSPALEKYVQNNLEVYKALNQDKVPDTGAGLPKHEAEAKDWIDALEAGLQMSVSGLGIRGKAPDEVLGQNPTRAMKIANMVGQMAGDLPAMAVGGSAGAMVGGPVGAGAGAFALPTAMRKIMMDHFQKGDIKSASDFMDRAMATTWDTAKSAATGGLVVATGGAAAAVAGPAAGFAAELAVMTGASAALDGRAPNLDDALNAGIVMAGFHGLTHITPKMAEIYAKTGEAPHEVLDAAQKDVILHQDLLNPDPTVPEQAHPSELKYPPKEAWDPPEPKEGEEAPPAMTAAEKMAAAQPTLEPKNLDPVANLKDDGGGDAAARSEAVQSILNEIVDRPEKKTDRFGINDLVVALKDDLNPLKILTDNIEKNTGDDLEPSKNPYILARNFRDWGGKLERTLRNDTIDFNNPNQSTGEGLIPILKRVPDQDLNGLNAFMVANRAVEKAGQGIEQGKFSLEQAKAVVEELGPKFGDIAQELVDFQNRVKQYAVDSGILSEEKSEKFDELNKNYVPLHKELDVNPLNGGPDGGSRGLFKAIGSSKRKIINPIQSIFENTAAIMQAAELNRVKSAIVNLPDLQESGLARLSKNPGAPGENEMTVKVNGESQKWELEPTTAAAVRALDYNPQFTSLWAKMFARPFKLATTALRMGVTGDIGFAGRHLERAAVVSEIQSANPGIPFVGTIKALGDMFGNSEDYWKFVSSGGGTGSLERVQHLIENQTWQNEATSLLGKAKEFAWPKTEDPFIKKAWNAAWSPLKAAEMMTQLADMAPRISEFKKSGGTSGDINAQTEAAFSARNISVDYARQGALVKMVSFAQPFLNVDMQGMFRAVEGLKSPKAVGMATAMITMPEIINFMMNHDDERYKNAPAWEHGAFMLVPINHWVAADKKDPLATVQGMNRTNPDTGEFEVNKGPMLRIPRAFTWGLLMGSIPHMMMSKFYDQNPEAFSNLREQVTKSMMPMGLTTLAQPMVEQATNHSMFKGNTLIPDYLEKLQPQYQYQPYTTEVAKQIGKGIGWLPRLGPENAPLASPIVIDNYIRAWGGTVGQWVVSALDAGLHAGGVGKDSTVAEKDWTQLPVVKEFFSHFPSTQAQSIADFKTNFAEHERNFNTVKMLMQAGDVPAADEIRKADPEMMNRLTGIKKNLETMGTAISKVNRNASMSPTDKRQLIDTITFQMMAQAEMANKAMAELRKGAH